MSKSIRNDTFCHIIYSYSILSPLAVHALLYYITSAQGSNIALHELLARNPMSHSAESSIAFSSEVRGAIVSTAAFAAMRAALLDLLAPHPVRVMFF